MQNFIINFILETNYLFNLRKVLKLIYLYPPSATTYFATKRKKVWEKITKLLSN